MKDGTKQKKKKGPGNFCFDFVKITGAIPTLLWLRPKVYRPFGKNKMKGGVMISANHRSYLDPIIMITVFAGRRIHCVATKDLFDSKLKRAFFTRMLCIEVDTENFGLSAFHEITDRLNSGKAVVIFPEGQINNEKPDSMLTFKSGVTLMAHKSGVPILPTYIVRREKWYQRQRVVVGEPIDVRAALGKMPTIEELNSFSELLRKKELELKEYYESRTKHKAKAFEEEKEVKEEIKK